MTLNALQVNQKRIALKSFTVDYKKIKVLVRHDISACFYVLLIGMLIQRNCFFVK